MKNDQLVHLALSGYPEAQDECTRLGIVLRCPYCGAPMEKSDRAFRHPDVECFLGKRMPSEIPIEALGMWNRRIVPQVGKCKDCANGNPVKHLGIPFCFCRENRRIKDPNDWCSSFKPKGREHET